MTASATFQGSINSGKVVWKDREGIAKYIGTLEGKQVLITIEEHHGRRTIAANAYLHWVFGLIAEETGHSPADIKQFMKERFLTVHTRRGKRVRGTSSLNRAEFGLFIEDVCYWAAQFLGVVVPPPESVPEAWE